MRALLVANNRTEETVGNLMSLDAAERRFAGCGAQRVLWFAQEGDTVVVPWAPDESYIEYVTMHTGIRPSSLNIIAPPPGHLGPDILSRDRLENPEFQDAVRKVFASRPPAEIVAFCGDATIARLARSLGAETAMPGYKLAQSGGVTLVNSKSFFRAIASGVGAPVPPGSIAYDQADGYRAIVQELEEGNSVIVKQDLQSGGKGNEVLSPEAGTRVYGASYPALVLNDPDAVRRYLTRRWDWLTGGNRHAVVIERYLSDVIPIFVEFLLNDEGPTFVASGEMLMKPAYAGVIVPAPRLPEHIANRFAEIATQVCAVVWAMGYRGTVSLDAIITPENRFFLTEINCRVGGSTHLQRVIRDRVLDPRYRGRRFLAERGGWPAPSFREAARKLNAEGLGYDPGTGKGVILTCDFQRADGTVRSCIVAEDADAIPRCEQMLAQIFGAHTPY
jgi:Pre ATP-grasp domain/PGM1 C-terminal domain